MSLVQDLAPAAVRCGFSLQRGRIEDRPVLLARLADGWDAGTVLDVVRAAERFGLPSISVADTPAGATVPPLGTVTRHPHVLLAEVPEPAASVLAAAGVLARGFLAGDHLGVDLAALALSYLPTAVGEAAPVFAPVERPDVEIGPSAGRNAVATAHAVCDDLLRVHREAGDELVLGLGRVSGRSLVVVAPQPVVSPVLGTAVFRALVEVVELSTRFGLPLVVLGGVQGFQETPVPLARALADVSSPVLLVADDTPGSTLQQLFSAAPTAVPLSSATVRADITRWID